MNHYRLLQNKVTPQSTDEDIVVIPDTPATIITQSCTKGGRPVGSTNKKKCNIEFAIIAAKNEIITLALEVMNKNKT